jgi:hypothetical protein
MEPQTTVECACGKAALELFGRPIMTVECLCDSCRAAGQLMQSLPGAPPIVDKRGATGHTMYRKDRIRCARGAENFREFRLKPESKTRRVVASCCNAAMFLEFTSGHWIDVYSRRWPDGIGPKPELRTMVGDLPPKSGMPSDIPNLKGHSARFFARLIGAWVAMRFRTPKIDFVKGTFDARAA